ncbi:hypothetical protein [Frankia sp. AgKG'84/4]|uniref:hypothetical protein n=1 Tax=Frankia sp. AgKG'84/4 TaxID=573490 RepID=UPI00200D9F96|nr:hypothetical protein [Frankia sp. AgKG'84/4]MCL9795831.1 hypothetical protein [Frankia sp. AgKG'84/4]
MKQVLTVLGCALIAIVVFLVVRDNSGSDSPSSSPRTGPYSGGGSGGGGSGGGGTGGGGTGGGSGGGSGGGTGDIKPGPDPEPKSTGAVDVSRRGTNGTERVDCADIDSELRISAFNGSVRWTAAPAAGVSVSPSSGFLDEGESQVVHVGGSYAGGGGFTVNVSAPSRSGGSGGVAAAFTCR